MEIETLILDIPREVVSIVTEGRSITVSNEQVNFWGQQ